MISPKSIRQLRRGNELAFRKIYDAYYAKVYHYCLSFTHQTEDAEEVAQNVFVQLWNQRKKVDLNRSLDAYLFTIAHHNACNFLKKKARTVSLNPNEVINLPSTRGTEDVIALNELSKTLRDTIDALPEKRQIIFRMHYEECRSDQEIAQTLQLSVHTIKSQLAKANRTIREAILAFSRLSASMLIALFW